MSVKIEALDSNMLVAISELIEVYRKQLTDRMFAGDNVTAAALCGLIEEQYRIMKIRFTDASKHSILPPEKPDSGWREATGDDAK